MALISICTTALSCLGDPGPADQAAPAQATTAVDMDQMVGIAFKDTPLEKICTFIGQKLGKPVIPHSTIKAKKITIIHHKNEPLGVALQVLNNALRQEGVIIQEYARHIEFLPIAAAHKTKRRVIGPEQSLSEVPDKSQIVDKVFVVKHYDVLKLKDVIVPMLPDYGYVMADPNIRSLIVTDTVANLERIERILARLDVPMADETIKRIFKIENADASDIVSLIRSLIAGSLGKEGKAMVSGGEGRKDGQASAVFIEHSKTPVMLMVDVTRNWIIAVAPAPIMTQIEQYIEQFDLPQEAEDPFEVFEVQYADMSEIATQIEDAIAALPNEDVKQSLRVVPFTQSRKLFVFGSERGRLFVKKLLGRLDVETSEYRMMKEFSLKHADAEQVADMIESLFSNRQLNYRSAWRSSFSYRGEQTVKVTFSTYRNSVTVVTDPTRMAQIEKLVREEWDQPPQIDETLPKVYHLKYADPVKVQEILENLYTKNTRTSGNWWDRSTEENTPVGRLFGQFSFQSMEDSNVLIVTTQSRVNYEVIDELMEELDRPQEAGLPITFELKHANAEDLAEQLNAMFAERGTLAQVPRSNRQLNEYSMLDEQEGAQQPQRNQPRQQEQQRAAPGMMDFWWSKGSHPSDQRQTSNLIGRPRIVPIVRRNALLVMAPLAYQERLSELIDHLDRPGMQVVIHAIVLEVRHSDTTTVGIRFASDPDILSDARLGDQAIGGRASSNLTDMFAGGRGVFNVDFDVSVLIQMLDKIFDLKVLLEPRIYTADNQEATFFDGQRVPFQSSSITTAEGSTNRSIGYQRVGTRLTVRPHITREGDVDLMINVEVSRVVPGEALAGNPTFDHRETDTHIVVKDGQMVMLSGIVRQEMFSEKRKIPIVGDIPLVGGLFQSKDTQEGNRELIVFITPRVVRVGADVDEAMKGEREILEKLKQQMRDEQDAR